MSERNREDPHDTEAIIEHADIVVVEAEQQRSGGRPDRDDVEDDGDDDPRLSAEQRRVAAGLLRLYESLAGPIPGQYSPQALLDSAGNFNRPPFPSRQPMRGSRR